jgi:tetratricopeptide (TPR) repeat protein
MSRQRQRPTPPARHRVTLVLGVALVLAGCLAYSNSFSGVFVADDVDAIVNNPHIRSLWPITSAASAPKDTTLAGRPVVSLSFALNYALAPASDRLDVRVYHAFNLGVHLCAGLLLFGVVRRTLLSSPLRSRFGGAAPYLAFSIALIWLLHPLHTQAVTYIVQRAESLMGLFYLLALYCAIRAIEPDGSWRWSVASIVACALGMGSKEVMVGAPPMVALWIWLFRRQESFLARRRLALFAGLAATWILLAWLVLSDARAESVGFGLGGWTWSAYLRTQAEVVVHYLRLALFPSPLVFMYSWPRPASWTQVAPQLVLLILLLALTAVAVVRRQPVGFIGAWFFLILAPSSSVVPIVTELAAEHRMYLPLAAVIAAVVLSAYVSAQRLISPVPRAAVALMTGVVAVSLGTATYARNRDYVSLETLMRDTVEKRPQNAKARVILGGHFLSLARYAEAEAELRSAISVPDQPGGDPGVRALAHMYLGSALAAQGNLEEGISHLERARALSPDLGEVHAFLGEAYASLGRHLEAARSLERAVALLPDVPPLLDRAARLLATSPDPSARNGVKAVQLAERGVQMTDAGDWRLLGTLAAAYAEAGRFADAVAAARQAGKLAADAGETQAAAAFRQHAAMYESAQPLRER